MASDSRHFVHRRGIHDIVGIFSDVGDDTPLLGTSPARTHRRIRLLSTLRIFRGHSHADNVPFQQDGLNENAGYPHLRRVGNRLVSMLCGPNINVPQQPRTGGDYGQLATPNEWAAYNIQHAMFLASLCV